MRLRAGIDATQKVVFSREVDLRKARFQISRGEILRVLIGFFACSVPSAFAFYLEQYPLMWGSLSFPVFISLWQIIYYGYMSNSKNKEELNVTNFYSKGALIFLATFGFLLITAVSVALYLKLPNP